MTQKFHDLVAGARSYRRFDQSKKMTMQELEELAELGRITHAVEIVSISALHFAQMRR